MYHASSIVSCVFFMTVYTLDVIVFGFPGAFAGYMLCRTFYASWIISALVLCVSKMLAAHALGDFPFSVWCLELYYCVQ